MPFQASRPRQPAGTVYIGCAGWSIPAASRPRFGAGASVLARYATVFDAVEINSSFYRPHRRDTYRRWADSVPEHFRFSAKLPRSITHDARLQRVGAELDRFADEVGGLGRKLAGVLVQLPPSLAFDAKTASTFFGMLRRRLPAAMACEPRHRSWFEPAADALLQRQRIARVAADPAIVPAARMPGGDPSWRYWRWHGSPRMYYSAYDDTALAALTDAIRDATNRGRRDWIIFDNTAQGHAVEDAMRLQARLENTARR